MKSIGSIGHFQHMHMRNDGVNADYAAAAADADASIANAFIEQLRCR